MAQQTPASGLAPYCSPAQMLDFVDIRTIAQLLSDGQVPISEAEALTSQRLVNILMSASGHVESACMVGSRYVINPYANPPINDLAALNGNSQMLLIQLVAGIACWLLWMRRPSFAPRIQLPGVAEIAKEMLGQLERGEAIFGTVEAQTSGVLSDYVEKTADVERRRLVEEIARPFFGTRSRELNG